MGATMGMIWIIRVFLYYDYVYMCQLWCSDWYIMPIKGRSIDGGYGDLYLASVSNYFVMVHVAGQ